ncbi:MAG: hypothetical protein ABIG96_01445 [Candidatus Micrarchaeota archaeon]
MPEEPIINDLKEVEAKKIFEKHRLDIVTAARAHAIKTSGPESESRNFEFLKSTLFELGHKAFKMGTSKDKAHYMHNEGFGALSERRRGSPDRRDTELIYSRRERMKAEKTQDEKFVEETIGKIVKTIIDRSDWSRGLHENKKGHLSEDQENLVIRFVKRMHNLGPTLQPATGISKC